MIPPRLSPPKTLTFLPEFVLAQAEVRAVPAAWVLDSVQVVPSPAHSTPLGVGAIDPAGVGGASSSRTTSITSM